MKHNNSYNYHVHLFCLIVILFNKIINVQSFGYNPSNQQKPDTTPNPFDTPENAGKIPKIFYLKSDDNICLIMKADMRLIIPLKGSRKNITSYLNSTTKNIKFTGYCHTTITNLEVEWTEPGQTNPWMLTFFFKLYSNEYYSLDTTSFAYELNDVSIHSSSKDEVFSVRKDQYYNCTKSQKIELHPLDRNYSTVRLVFKSLEVEAFRESPQTGYIGTESQCSSEEDESLTYIIVSISIFTMTVVMIFVLCLSNDESLIVGAAHYR
ncbi:unnamed protein product [Schistosoma turkestanicum]|nr:unnamed protein product [Schistosoma turkestanicum]